MKKTVLHASIFALTMPMSLYAIGLGNMTVKSALDQPFSAEIELIDVGSTPLPGIKVGLADPENFEEIGLERTAILSLLSFKIVRNAQGKYIILVESQERMTEPYMEVVVDLTWPKGQLYKAYTVLLDPPGYQLVSTTAQSSPTHYKRVKKHTYEPGVVDKTVTTRVEHNPVEINDNKKKATYGPTVTNENVWQIAQRYKTSEVILPQVVLAIVGANPDAFKEGNLNGLKVGVQLIIPATEEILQIPSDLATEEIMAHDKAWNEKTAIIHVLSPPYMNGHPVNTAPPVKSFQIPVIPKQIIQTGSSQGTASSMIPIESSIPIIHTNQFQALQNNTQPQSSEQYSTTKAELSITTAAVESVRESNALLMEQLHLLQDQNKKLQQQLDKREKELDKIHRQMEVLMKERLALASQASSINSSDSSLGYWPLFLLLIAAAGGGFAYWYLKLRRQEDNKESPYLTDITNEPKPFAPLVEPVPLKVDEASFSPPGSDSVSAERMENEPTVDTSVDENKTAENTIGTADEGTGENKDLVIFEAGHESEPKVEPEKPIKKSSGRKKKKQTEEPVFELASKLDPHQSEQHAATEATEATEIENSLSVKPAVDIEPKIDGEIDTGLVEFESAREETKVNTAANEFKSPLDESTSDELPSNDLLEFESGLHELIPEKTKSQKSEDQSNDSEMDMGLDFVSPLDEPETKEQNKVSVHDDKDEGLNLEDAEDNQDISIEFENDNSKLDASDTEHLDSDLEKSITDFFVEPADESNIDIESTESNHTQVNPESVTQNENSNPLKSTKALNTLLDLAKTYIGMDDFESARHSLDEVLEYGSDAQKEEARRLLAQINDN